jgi:hypothetical protein
VANHLIVRLFTNILFVVSSLVGAAFVAGPEALAEGSAVASVISQKNTAKSTQTGSRTGKPVTNGYIPPASDEELPSLQDVAPANRKDEASDVQSSQEDEPPAEEGMVQVRIRINVPQKIRANSAISVYPYPPRPPRNIIFSTPLPTKDKQIRGQLLNTGYAGRTSLDKTFPPGGWRWQYAMRDAINKSGANPPTTILTMYPWINRILPYMREEIAKVNEVEKDRKIRYQAICKDFEENGQDLENEAMQKGLSPVELRMRYRTGIRMLSGVANVTPGTWWVVATHKVPGLHYFWMQPITVVPGENMSIQLTQANAIAIQGGW